MKKTRFIFIVILLLCFLILLSVSPTYGQEPSSSIIYVGGTGPGNHSSIHSALLTAPAGSVVFVYNGTYYEHLVIEKSIQLIGEHKDTTIIDGNGSSFVVTLTADHITISGFTITNSQKKFPFAGIYVTSDFNTISDTILTDNYYGIHLGYLASGNLIVNNSIFSNKQCGIYFNHASNNRLIGNVVSDHPVNGFGLYEFSNNNIIVNNTFSLNQHTGINIRESYQNQVIGNSFDKDEVGLHTPSPEYQTTARDNVFIQNPVALDEERDAVVFTVVIFDILVFFVFVMFRKISF